MKQVEVRVPWAEGLRLRQAIRLVKASHAFHSKILLTYEGRIADASSLIGVLTLCAKVGMVLNLEVSGADELEAVQSVAEIFLG